MPGESATRRRVLSLVGTVSGVGALSAGASATATTTDTDSSEYTGEGTIEDTGDPATRTRQAAQPETEPYASLYEELIDGVVLVSVVGAEAPGEGGIGSGFVFDDTHLVTNEHVVSGASAVELQFVDEQWREAEVVGTDVHSDLAVLRVEDLPADVDPIALAEDDPVVGQEVLALGNPLGLDASVSQGIVSGVDRALESPTGFSVPATIQTDAPVNPGNSGGPLVDLDGEVVGVVFAGAGPGGTIGFAISAALADRVVPQLIEEGEYDHAYMGVGVVPVGPAVADANDLDEPRGILVTEVVPDAPAADVLQPADEAVTVDGALVPAGGDVIVAIDETEIPNEDLLASFLALETSPEETIDVEVVREGEREIVELTLGTRPDVDAP